MISENEKSVLENLFRLNDAGNILNEVENSYKKLDPNSFAAHILSFIKILLKKNDKEAFLELKEIEKNWGDEQLTICCQIIFDCFKYNHKNLSISLDEAKKLVESLEKFESAPDTSFKKYAKALCLWVETANQDIRAFYVDPFWINFTETVFEYSPEYQEEQARKAAQKKAENAKIAEQKRIAEEKKKAEAARLAEEKKRIEFEKYKKEEKKKCVIKFIIFAFIIPLIVLESVTFGLDCFVQNYIMKSFWGIWPYVVIFLLGCIVGVLGVKRMVKYGMENFKDRYFHFHIRFYIYELLIPHIFLVTFLFFEAIIMGLGYYFVNVFWVELALIAISVFCIIIGIYMKKEGDWLELGFVDDIDPLWLVFLGAFFIFEIALFIFVGEHWYWIVWFVALSIISVFISYRFYIKYIEDGCLFFDNLDVSVNQVGKK